MTRLTPEQVAAVLAEANAEWLKDLDAKLEAAGLPPRRNSEYERRTAPQREDHQRQVVEFYRRLDARKQRMESALAAVPVRVERTPEEIAELQARLEALQAWSDHRTDGGPVPAV